MYRWHTDPDMSDDEVGDAIDDAMVAEGLNPDSFEDQKGFVDKANGMAADAGLDRHYEIEAVDAETGELYPNSGGALGWYERTWLGRQFN